MTIVAPMLDEREQDPALELPPAGRDLGAGSLVGHLHQSGDRRRQVGFAQVVGVAVDELAGEVEPGAPSDTNSFVSGS